MRFLEITLLSQNLSAQKSFFTNSLGFEIIEESESSFSINIGWTKLIFEKTLENISPYHYCFLIPCNKLDEALTWISKRATLLPITDGIYKQHFGTWNADSFYFYDGDGNLAECIVRHDLNNPSDNPFSKQDLLCLNELGLPCLDISAMNDLLTQKMDSTFWKGDFTRLGRMARRKDFFFYPTIMKKRLGFLQI